MASMVGDAPLNRLYKVIGDSVPPRESTFSFHDLAVWLKEKGEERALDIHIQRSDIFEAMHRI